MRMIIAILMLVYSVAGSAETFAETFDESLDCLAKNIYFEARNQSVKGQYAVGLVTLNRTKSQRYPNTICKVVWQKSQFSWTSDGKPDNPKNNVAWLIALSIANDLLTGKHRDHTKGAIYYHADYVKPDWASSFKLLTKIDNHVFYR